MFVGRLCMVQLELASHTHMLSLLSSTSLPSLTFCQITSEAHEHACILDCRYADPGYFEGDPEEEDAPDPLQRALHNKEAYQHIRALPAEAGAAVLFTHRWVALKFSVHGTVIAPVGCGSVMFLAVGTAVRRLQAHHGPVHQASYQAHIAQMMPSRRPTCQNCRRQTCH